MGTAKHEIRKTRKEIWFPCVPAFVLCWYAVVQPPGLLHAQADTLESPLVTWEDVLPARGGVVLWVRNPTSDTVWVDSLHVESCLNIRRGGCGTRALGLVLPPGGSKELLRLVPAVPRDPFGYQWFLDWKTAKVDATGPRRRRHGNRSTSVIRT
jgi:hypothetical protein